MPTLHWVGKDKVVNHHHDVPFRVLNKVSTFAAPEGTPANTTDNRIIHGDNLETLKSVRESWQLYFTGSPIGTVLGLNPSTHRAGLAAVVPIYTPVPNMAQVNTRTLKQAHEAYEVFALDAIPYPGNSGSPVWHPDTGEVFGVVNSVYVKGAKEAALTAPSGISYAIPVKYVHALIEKALPEAK